MGRPRQAGSRDLPPNLYYERGRGRYRYKHPITGVKHPFGNDKAKAVAAAKKLNDMLAKDDSLVQSIIAPEQTVQQIVDWFHGAELPARNLKAKSLENYHSMGRRIAAALGHIEGRALQLDDVAALLRDYDDTPTMRNKLRGYMADIFRCAIAEGWMDSNPAEATRKKKVDRQRKRLTRAMYDAIHDCAPAWLQATMDLDLAILSRREDLVQLRFDRHLTGDSLELDLIKSEQMQAGERQAMTRLSIVLDDRLRELIAACRDHLACPYIVHCRSERAKPREQWPEWRQHAFQVAPDYLTRAFSAARDRAFKKHPELACENPPSFHEIRSLGAALYRAAGMPEEQIQALLGHTDIATTRIYLRDHEAPRQFVSTRVQD